MDAVYVEVDTPVRYPEDATVNGQEDENGDLMPFLINGRWRPRIRLDDGVVMDWPPSVVAEVHYKVSDAGEYWLQNADGVRVARWSGYYVPDTFLCHGDRGFGDYIIFRVGGDGCINGYRRPVVDLSEWEPMADIIAAGERALADLRRGVRPTQP
jgi:hypothetical protein